VGRFFLAQDRHVGSKSSLRNCGSEDIIACGPDPGALRGGVGTTISGQRCPQTISVVVSASSQSARAGAPVSFM
jgi:hypothetical protein